MLLRYFCVNCSAMEIYASTPKNLHENYGNSIGEAFPSRKICANFPPRL